MFCSSKTIGKMEREEILGTIGIKYSGIRYLCYINNKDNINLLLLLLLLIFHWLREFVWQEYTSALVKTSVKYWYASPPVSAQAKLLQSPRYCT